MKEYLISTKADTLADLREIVKHSYIEELSIVYAEDFFGNPAGVIAAIKEQFTGETIVVRSSSKSEDNLETSNAGHFESVLGVIKGCSNYRGNRDSVSFLCGRGLHRGSEAAAD